MAGVSAAKQLKGLGYTNFEILEGLNRVGGRAVTTNIGNYTLERGPLYVSDFPGNPVFALLTKYNVSIQRIDYDDLIVRNTNGMDVTVEFNNIYEKFETAVEQLAKNKEKAIAENRPDISLRSAFSMVGWFPTSFLEDVIDFFTIDWDFAFDTGECSFKHSSFPEIFVRESYWITDERGYSIIIKNTLDEVLENDMEKLKLNTVVTEIKETESQIIVTTKNGEKIAADYVIVTVSIGVLKSNSIKFKPELPEWKTHAIHNVDLAQWGHIYVQFNASFWEENTWILYAGGTDGFIILNYNIIYPGSNILCIDVTNKNAIYLERLSEEEAEQEIIDMLQKIYGPSNIVIPSPINFKRSSFSTDPFFLTAWSNRPPGYSRERHTALQAPVSRIYFAGEHTHYKDYGYLRGAYYSGTDVSNALDKCVQRCKCQKYIPVCPSTPCRYGYEYFRKRKYGICKYPDQSRFLSSRTTCEWRINK